MCELVIFVCELEMNAIQRVTPTDYALSTARLSTVQVQYSKYILYTPSTHCIQSRLREAAQRNCSAKNLETEQHSVMPACRHHNS